MGLLLEAPTTSFVDRLVWLAEKLNKDALSSFASLAWAAWFCRNKEVFGDVENINPSYVATGFMKLKMEYGEYNKVGSMVHPPQIPMRSTWSLPPTTFVKINVDAHVRHDVGVSFGMVIRDEGGNVVAAGVRRIASNWRPALAEAGAAQFGVEVARRMGFEKVMLESDSINVVQAIRQRQRGAAPIFLLFDDIIDMSSYFSSFQCSHVKRAGNTIAHNVARWDVMVGSENICTHSFPQSIQTLAGLDFL
ncbi:uncharacterized protein LOC125494668 [Beta vulgaris subsp. vulgaris]|uniref:uncharacterized protein LOC125494668 n=1 Tax=Beta vulgaris subsp. vulgaris TaxID=3555 RepID=UPI0020376500|nr:uncharacterized protein LOC125494668 [Beta vulgaris subsp. vulgaris]